MLFNSFTFAIFLPLVFILYWALPHKYRWILLWIASYYFYMNWNIKYIFLIFFTTLVSYLAAISIEKEKHFAHKKKILIITTTICIGILFFFKYFNFFNESISNIMSIFSLQLNPVTLDLLLPVGISFYTFQTLSYVIDVYKGDSAAEHHFGKYATFISFFPQLVAGPIERTSNLLPQINAEHKFDYNQATYGLKLMAWGYFKKLVIADVLSEFVSKVYNTPQEFQGFALVLATIFFTIQIYCDFSGYSDIAIGTANLFGINLMTNFKSPYFSQSIKEFWSRWHISLSTWFKDYVYIPLGGNRVSKLRHNINLIITFLVSGLWHGANWTFVIWGGIHGLAQVLENSISFSHSKKRMAWLIKVSVVFLFCAFSWIFFASNTISDAIYVVSHLFDGLSNPLSYILNGFITIGMSKIKLTIILFNILLLSVYDYISLTKDCITLISEKNIFIRYICYIFLLSMIILFKASGQAEFVYFQF